MMKDGCKVKICGITSLEDRDLVYRAGADFFGVIVDVPYSPRTLSMETAACLLKDAPLPGAALVFRKDLRQLKHLLEYCRPQAVQFLSPLPPEWLRELKACFPQVGWWQSLFLPAADAAAPLPEIEEQLRENLCRRMQELSGAGADAVILDTAVKNGRGRRLGGTGQTSNWRSARLLAEKAPLPVFLAGGLKPSNIKAALDAVHPDGIDLCSGVEANPGRKDPDLLREMISAVREWEKENTDGKDER